MKLTMMDGTEVPDISPYVRQDWEYLSEHGQTMLSDERSQIIFLHEIAAVNGMKKTWEHLEMMAMEYKSTNKIDDSMYYKLRKYICQDLEELGLRNEFQELYNRIPLKLKRM